MIKQHKIIITVSIVFALAVFVPTSCAIKNARQERNEQAKLPAQERIYSHTCEQVYKHPEVWRCGSTNKYGQLSRWANIYITKEPFNIVVEDY